MDFSVCLLGSAAVAETSKSSTSKDAITRYTIALASVYGMAPRIGSTGTTNVTVHIRVYIYLPGTLFSGTRTKNDNSFEPKSKNRRSGPPDSFFMRCVCKHIHLTACVRRTSVWLSTVCGLY